MRSSGYTRRRLCTVGITAGTAALAGCLTGGAQNASEPSTATTAAPELSGRVRIAGSSTVYPMTLEVGRRFSERYPEVTVDVSSTGTGSGFADFFCSGRTAFNDASRSITGDEQAACEAADVTPLAFHVATDALTVVVNADADWVDCLSVDELARIWSADGAERWSDLDPSWPDEPFEFYGPSSASGTFDYFRETVIGEGGTHRTDYGGTEQDSTIIEGVRESPYAIGYLGLAYYVQNADAVKAVAVDGAEGCVRPSQTTAKQGTYVPLSRPLYLYVAREALEREVVRRFCSFYLDRTTTDLASQVGYVPISPAVNEQNRQLLQRTLADR